jgi:hypothetical protein
VRERERERERAATLQRGSEVSEREEVVERTKLEARVAQFGV